MGDEANVKQIKIHNSDLKSCKGDVETGNPDSKEKIICSDEDNHGKEFLESMDNLTKEYEMILINVLSDDVDKFDEKITVERIFLRTQELFTNNNKLLESKTFQIEISKNIEFFQNLYKFFFLIITTKKINLKSYEIKEELLKILYCSLNIFDCVDVFTVNYTENNEEDIDQTEIFSDNVLVFLNFLLQLLEDTASENVETNALINEMFTFFIENDLKFFNEKYKGFKLSKRKFWGKSSFLLNIFSSIFSGNNFRFKINLNNTNFVKFYTNLIYSIIKTYPIITTSIEIDNYLYENENYIFRSLSIVLLEKKITFFKEMYVTNNQKEMNCDAEKKDMENLQTNLLFLIIHSLYLLTRRINDTSFYVRLKCISSLIILLSESVLPLFFVNSINFLVLTRLTDKTLLVKRKAVEYLKIAIAKHPYVNDIGVKKACGKFLKELSSKKSDNDKNTNMENNNSLLVENDSLNTDLLEDFFFEIIFNPANIYEKNSLSPISLYDLKKEIQNLADYNAITLYISGKTCKNFYLSSISNYARFLHTVLKTFSNSIFIILNTNTANPNIGMHNNLCLNITDIDNWMEILVMCSVYGYKNESMDIINTLYFLSNSNVVVNVKQEISELANTPQINSNNKKIENTMENKKRLITIMFLKHLTKYGKIKFNQNNFNIKDQFPYFVKFIISLNENLAGETHKYKCFSNIIESEDGWLDKLEDLITKIESLNKKSVSQDMDVVKNETNKLVNDNETTKGVDIFQKNNAVSLKEKENLKTNLPALIFNLDELILALKYLKIKIPFNVFKKLMRLLYHSKDEESLVSRQRIIRNSSYIVDFFIETDTFNKTNINYIIKTYEFVAKMNYLDLKMDEILLERIYKQGNLNVNDVVSKILETLSSSSSPAKMFSFLENVVLLHAEYLEEIGVQMKSNLESLTMAGINLNNDNYSDKNEKIREIFKHLKSTPKKYRMKRKSINHERTSIRESIGSSMIQGEETIKKIKEDKPEENTSKTSINAITENDIDDAIFYLKDHEMLYGDGCLNKIFLDLVKFCRKKIKEFLSNDLNIVDPEKPEDDEVLVIVAFTALYKCMTVSSDVFASCFDIFKNILINGISIVNPEETKIPLPLIKNTLITLCDFTLNYNSFVESLNHVFFDALYIEELHDISLLLIVHLGKHQILKINGTWLKLFLSFEWCINQSYNKQVVNAELGNKITETHFDKKLYEEKEMITEFLHGESENTITLLVYECISGILYGSESENILKATNNGNWKIIEFFIKTIFKITLPILKEKSRVSLFLRLLRIESEFAIGSNENANFSSENVDVLNLVYKLFEFSDKVIADMEADECYKKWRLASVGDGYS